MTTEKSYYKIKIETTDGTFYVAEYYSNKYVVKIALCRDIKCANLFRGKRTSGPGSDDRPDMDAYGVQPNYAPSATVYAALNKNEWFVCHKSLFNDSNNEFTIEEEGKKRAKGYHGVDSKKINLIYI